ncbi:MAG: discoidin domain-containing protein, partial [Flavobacteriaceae bacterium]|nr:discoidin domain-containing protein [Flavobacteriaceae bacterium]
EEIRSYWVSQSNNDSIYVTIDLQKKMQVKALQINFQDYNSRIFGRPDTLRQQFTIETSLDGKKWKTIVDKSKNTEDTPHTYLELEKPEDARFVRYNHVYCTNEYLSISEFRIFGNGYEAKPEMPNNFQAKRQSDRRNVNLTWDKMDNATGYVVYWGIAEDKLNLSALLYDEPNYEIRALNIDQPYYVQVEAFNENGISERSKIIYIE